MDRSLSLVLNGERPFCRPSLEPLHVFFKGNCLLLLVADRSYYAVK